MRGLYLAIVLGLFLTFLVCNLFAKVIRRNDIKRLTQTALISGTFMETWNVIGMIRGHWWYGRNYLIFPNSGVISLEDILFCYVTAPFVLVFLYESVRKLTVRFNQHASF